MESLKEIIVTVICAVLASSGLWTILIKRMDKRSSKTSMLIGLGHDRIMILGMQYIDRGYIYADEYENLCDYLYKPYSLLGGNGSAEKIMEEVKRLPIKTRGDDNDENDK